MTNEEISFNTKKTLSKALKSRVEHMPFDKIKVSHLIKIVILHAPPSTITLEIYTNCWSGYLNLKLLYRLKNFKI